MWCATFVDGVFDLRFGLLRADYTRFSRDAWVAALAGCERSMGPKLASMRREVIVLSRLL